MHQAGPEAIHHEPPIEEVLMQQQHGGIFFRVPGEAKMFDFEQIRDMNLHPSRVLGVIEVVNEKDTRNSGSMAVSAILTKFG